MIGRAQKAAPNPRCLTTRETTRPSIARLMISTQNVVAGEDAANVVRQVAGREGSRPTRLVRRIFDGAGQHVVPVGLDEREEEGEGRDVEQITLLEHLTEGIAGAPANNLRRSRPRRRGFCASDFEQVDPLRNAGRCEQDARSERHH